MADTLAPFPPPQPPPERQEKHEFTVRQRVPAFRADDSVLEELWRTMRDKCAETGEPRTSLTFSTTTQASGNGPREEHEHKYERIDDLRRSPDKPDRLHEYSLYASTSLLDNDGRSISFNAYRDGATVTAKAPDGEWCREAASAILAVLHTHTTWYAPIFRISVAQNLGALAVAWGLLIARIAITQEPPSSTAELAFWATVLATMTLPLYRELFFSAAEIRMERRRSNVVTLDRGPRADGPKPGTSQQ